jgi:hypothetical protein
MDETGGNADDIDWAPIRRDYEAGVMTRNAVARKHEITLGQIEQRARSSKWLRPNSAVLDRHILIFKLLALLERQIDQVDGMMNKGGAREVSVLTNMVRDLEKLIAIEKAEAGQAPEGSQSKDMRDLQRKLEKRINAITKA